MYRYMRLRDEDDASSADGPGLDSHAVRKLSASLSGCLIYADSRVGVDSFFFFFLLTVIAVCVQKQI